MKIPDSDHTCFETVSSFSELIDTDFHGTVNALCWKRELNGDFREVVSQLQLEENITVITSEDLSKLKLSEYGETAREIILNDLRLLKDFGASPTLNLLKNYERDDEFDFISTDVYSFHVDRSPVLTDTFLCTYHGASSDILPNDQAVQNILIPEIREKLKALHEGPENEFETFLEENFFDLHYQSKSDSQPITLGQGNLWRLAVDHPEQKVLPSIHRAPVENDGEYRLLLIC
ncbi:hypothetical protein ASG31_09515 [Chryseobacterium sp. Leaf404]|uniref:DUF1826 domain-containing protein n=1 Tax=unclassified Chryseobacterium TaxID=2593645 RepID=UPI0006F51B33|nr:MULTISPECIES: DUF1826 domain-containing protein [unclassified Chryseobacterium]KQT17625.1 hypothetical protein ASG31_09515 [Chryseobacterium sp. Leaf404]